jgi:hypothetical protein
MEAELDHLLLHQINGATETLRGEATMAPRAVKGELPVHDPRPSSSVAPLRGTLEELEKPLLSLVVG